MGDFPRQRRVLRQWEPRSEGAAVQNMIHLGFLLVVLAAALLPAGRGRVLAAAGAVSAGLALAGLGAGPEAPVTALPAGFLAVEGALLAVGAVLAIAAGVVGIRPGRGSGRTQLGAAASALGGLGVGLSAAPYLRFAAPLALLAAVVTTAGLGLILIRAGHRLGRSSGSSERFPASPKRLAAVTAGALLATVSPWVDPIFLGAMLTAAGGWAAARENGPRRLPVAPALTLLVLIPAWWLMRTIAGPEGLATVSLPDLPWSPAAERLLGALLLLGAWSISGLWPLQRQQPAVLTAPMAALLMARVAIPAFPDGLEHWRALALPLGLIGLWHGVVTGSRGEALVGLAWIGLATATIPGQAGAGLLLVGALIFVLAERVTARIEAVLRPIAALAVGAGALLVTEAGLGTEVVYTVSAVAALVAAAGRPSPAQASTASELSATAPRA